MPKSKIDPNVEKELERTLLTAAFNLGNKKVTADSLQWITENARKRIADALNKFTLEHHRDLALLSIGGSTYELGYQAVFKPGPDFFGYVKIELGQLPTKFNESEN